MAFQVPPIGICFIIPMKDLLIIPSSGTCKIWGKFSEKVALLQRVMDERKLYPADNRSSALAGKLLGSGKKLKALSDASNVLCNQMQVPKSFLPLVSSSAAHG